MDRFSAAQSWGPGQQASPGKQRHRFEPTATEVTPLSRPTKMLTVYMMIYDALVINGDPKANFRGDERQKRQLIWGQDNNVPRVNHPLPSPTALDAARQRVRTHSGRNGFQRGDLSVADDSDKEKSEETKMYLVFLGRLRRSHPRAISTELSRILKIRKWEKSAILLFAPITSEGSAKGEGI
ncbi:MAG: hypothetical protein Q9200_002774 [Gallowayella weberi]